MKIPICHVDMNLFRDTGTRLSFVELDDYRLRILLKVSVVDGPGSSLHCSLALALTQSVRTSTK